MGATDIALLRLLVATAKKQKDFLSFLPKVYAAALALVYAQFTQPAPDGLNVAKVSELLSLQPNGDFLLCPGVSEAREPSGKFFRLLDCDQFGAFELQIVNGCHSSTSQLSHLSHIAPTPPDAPDDVDLVAGPLVGAVLVVVGDNSHARWITHLDELQPLGHEPHAVMQNNKDAWRVWAALCHVDQDDVAILQRRDHAAGLNGHDADKTRVVDESHRGHGKVSATPVGMASPARY